MPSNIAVSPFIFNSYGRIVKKKKKKKKKKKTFHGILSLLGYSIPKAPL